MRLNRPRVRARGQERHISMKTTTITRKARLNSPGTVARLMGRNVSGVDLFRHDKGRRSFLQPAK